MRILLFCLILTSCQIPLPQGYSLEPPKAELFPIQDYNAHLKGKLKGQSANFVESAEKHGLNPKMLIGIAMWETGDGSSGAIRKYNNAMGAKRKGRLVRYSSVKASIEAMAKNLADNYRGRTVAAIAEKYCPDGTRAWIKGVRGKMKKLK